MSDRGRGTGGPPPSLGAGEQVAPVASALTALLTATNRMMEKLDEQGSRSKGDKSSGTLSDSQSAEKRLQSMQAAINRLPLQGLTWQTSATHIGESGGGPWHPYMNCKSLVQRFSDALRSESEGANTSSITSLSMARQAEETDLAARAKLVLPPASGAPPSINDYRTVCENFTEYIRTICEVLAQSDAAKASLETPPRQGAPSHYNALVGNLNALKKHWSASHLFGAPGCEILLWRNMYVLTQYALGNDASPENKRMMQTLNLALPDGRGLHHNAPATGASSMGAGTVGTAGGGGKTQRTVKPATMKPGSRFPESSFLIGGPGAPCSGPCDECGGKTHHRVECPDAFFREWGTPMPGFMQPLGHGVSQSREEQRDPDYWAPGGAAFGPSDMVMKQWVKHEWDLGDQKLRDQAEGRGMKRRSFWSGWEDAWKKFS